MCVTLESCADLIEAAGIQPELRHLLFVLVVAALEEKSRRSGILFVTAISGRDGCRPSRATTTVDG